MRLPCGTVSRSCLKAPDAAIAEWTEHLDAASGATCVDAACCTMHMAERVPRYAHRRIAVLHNGLHLSLFLLSKRRYFYNARTGEKSWTRPAAPQQPVGPVPAPEPAPDPAPAPAVGADEVRRLTAPVIPTLSDPSNVASKMQTHLISDFLTRVLTATQGEALGRGRAETLEPHSGLRAAFARFDANGDGILNLQEVGACCISRKHCCLKLSKIRFVKT